LNGFAIAALGIGILGQAIIASWCLCVRPTRIRTWSSNPLAVALACVHTGDLQHHPSRSMLGVNAAASPSTVRKPAEKQASARTSHPSVRHIVRFLWIVALAALGWPLAVFLLTKRSEPYPSWPFMTDKRNGDIHIANLSLLFPAHSLPYIKSFAIIAGLQALFTVALHSAELVVNLSRDESAGRRASTPFLTFPNPAAAFFHPPLRNDNAAPGATLTSNALKAQATSPQALLLFAFKPLIHWIFGLCVALCAQERDNDDSHRHQHEGALILTQGVPIFVLFATCVLLTVFVTFLA
jgi:hypothetical protein